MSHLSIVLGLHAQNVLLFLILSAIVILFGCLSFQVSTINKAWRELSTSYRLTKKLEWRKWPHQTIFILPERAPLRALRTAMLRKNVTVALSTEGLGLFIFPYVRLGTSTPVCIPWHHIETGERAVFNRAVTEYRIAKLPGYTICLPSNLAEEEQAEQICNMSDVGSSLAGNIQRRTP